MNPSSISITKATSSDLPELMKLEDFSVNQLGSEKFFVDRIRTELLFIGRVKESNQICSVAIFFENQNTDTTNIEYVYAPKDFKNTDAQKLMLEFIMQHHTKKFCEIYGRPDLSDALLESLGFVQEDKKSRVWRWYKKGN